MSRKLIVRDPLFPFVNLQKEFDDLLNNFFPSESNSNNNSNVFSLNFIENKDSYDLAADIPGVSKDDIVVEEDNGMLRISVERKEEINDEDKERNYLRKEVQYGKYERVMKMPEDSNFADISAKYENGVLNVRIPKKEEIKVVNKIEIH